MTKLEPRPIEIFLSSPPDIMIDSVLKETKSTDIPIEVSVEETERKDEQTVETPIVEEPKEDEVTPPTQQQPTEITEAETCQMAVATETMEPVLIQEPEPQLETPTPDETGQEETAVQIEAVEVTATVTKEAEKTEEPAVEPTTEIKIEKSGDEDVKEMTVEVPPVDIQIPELSISVEPPQEQTVVDVVLEPVSKHDTVQLQTALAAELPAVEVKVPSKPSTSILDMPLIDVFIPPKSPEKKVKEAKKTTTKKKTLTEEKPTTEKPPTHKDKVPAEIYIDMPIVDLVEPPKSPSAVQPIAQKEKKVRLYS